MKKSTKKSAKPVKITRKSFVREWVKDLRSGEFTQYQGRLISYSDNKCRCCLGVASHTARRIGLIDKSKPMGSIGLLEPKIAKLFGDSNPDLTTKTSCVIANDQLGWSFKKIANALEKKYLKKT